MSKIQLGYWGIRGRGQIPRLLLSHVGKEFQQIVYTSPEQWFGKDKMNLGMTLPNLPYLIDGDFKLSESVPIAYYIVNSSDRQDLLGKDIKDQAMVDNMVGVIRDVITPIYEKLFFNPQYEKEIENVWNRIKPKLDQLQKFIGEKDYMLGYLTLADFFLAEFGHYIEKVYPEQWKQYPFLQRIRDNFEKEKGTQEYYSRPNAIKGPFLPPNMVSIQF